MKLKIDFSEIIKARESIGAPLGTKQTFQRLETELSSIELAFLETGYVLLSAGELEEKLVFVGGIPSIENQPVTLHIYQPHQSREQLETEPCLDGPRYHFYDCGKMESMRKGGRFNRYVATAGTDGSFVVQPKNEFTEKWEEEMQSRLLPCRLCLSALNYDNYNSISAESKNLLVNNFPIDEMLETLKPIFRCLPIYSNATMPAADYSSDWPKISIHARQASNWLCDCCGVRLEKKTGKGLLHVHHKDGIRGNNRPSNLRVLCAGCHKNQPYHGHMKLDLADLNYLSKMRQEQGLGGKCNSC